MSTYMNIDRYGGESEDSFIYRLCYSAIGQWCLFVAKNIIDGNIGTTKHNQTKVLNELVSRYTEIFPKIADRFINTSNPQLKYPVHIRRVYEETGYLLTDDGNRNHLAKYGRTIPIGNTGLFFGIPNSPYIVNGLGVFSDCTEYKVTTKDFLIRDELIWEEYFHSQFDIVDFHERDINLDELDFFNPLSKKVPSQSWGKRMGTDCTIARIDASGPFYRVMRIDNAPLQFAEEPQDPKDESFTSYEYRRLYFALKAHYNNPLKVIISKQDQDYSIMKFGGHLPNREYYYLLLLSWPVNNVFDKSCFLIRNDFIPEVNITLKNIGIKVEGWK